MTRANAVLAPSSGHSGVLFHGMAGAGKTACALELAYGQRANFAHLIWCKAPPEGAEMNMVKATLGELARRLDLALGVALADDTANPDRLGALTEAMEARSVLVVIDNAESLLSAAGPGGTPPGSASSTPWWRIGAGAGWSSPPGDRRPGSRPGWR